MRKMLMRLLLLGAALCLPAIGSAQGTGQTKVDQAKPKTAEPCCNIVAISVTDGVVTARETASGYTFKFKLTDKKLLSVLKVGDKVWADFAAKKVRLLKADAQPCCAIIANPASVPQ